MKMFTVLTTAGTYPADELVYTGNPVKLKFTYFVGMKRRSKKKKKKLILFKAGLIFLPLLYEFFTFFFPHLLCLENIILQSSNL